jgi:hypothetical protein
MACASGEAAALHWALLPAVSASTQGEEHIADLAMLIARRSTTARSALVELTASRGTGFRVRANKASSFGFSSSERADFAV